MSAHGDLQIFSRCSLSNCLFAVLVMVLDNISP